MNGLFLEKIQQISKLPEFITDEATCKLYLEHIIRKLHKNQKQISEKAKFNEICFNPILDRVAILAWLNEAYKKPDFTIFDKFFKAYFLYLDNIMQDAIWEQIEALTKMFVVLDSLASNRIPTLRAEYSTVEKTITFFINNKMFEELKQDNLRDEFLIRAKGFFVHETTHKHQDIKSKGLFAASYKEVDKSKIPIDYSYFNQKIEADAYGRQVGQLLKSRYPNTSYLKLLEMISTGNLSDPECQVIFDIFKSPEISKNIREKFLRATHDFVAGLELET